MVDEKNLNLPPDAKMKAVSKKTLERVTDIRAMAESFRTDSEPAQDLSPNGVVGGLMDQVKDLNIVLDDYAVRGVQALWAVASDPTHPWHVRYGFDALREVVRLCVPKRREVSGSGGGAIDVNLGSLFYSNSLDRG